MYLDGRTRAMKELIEDFVNLDEMARGKNTKETVTQIMTWIHSNLTWSVTDYQKRTVIEILQNGKGNCAEQAKVLITFLEKVGIKGRWMAEVNIQPYSLERELSSKDVVKEVGNVASVFGLRHNDHRWLEVFSEEDQEWFPVDPTMNIIGIDDWVASRLGFTSRKNESILASLDMIVPFTVIVIEDNINRKPVMERTNYYLNEQFNKYYANHLSQFPQWMAWEESINRLTPLVIRSFQGEVNLHDYNIEIEQVEYAYQMLKSEWINCGNKVG